MKKLFISVLFLCSALVNAQPLLTIGGEAISADEFMTMYNKKSSYQDTTKTPEEALKEYLDLYIKFKIIVKEAEGLGLDTVKKFKDELAGYRNQLAESYMTDKNVTEELVKEAYERLKYEVHASHILVLCRPDDMPEDTLIAYKKALDIMNKAKAGQDFGKLAMEYSGDPSAKENKGDLGYFAAMKMVYPFETAAYNTPVGQVSKPVRTKFGYHILKIQDKRPTQGSINAAHIMITTKQHASAEEVANAKTRIDEIYSKLQGGTPWNELAKLSEDPQSVKKNGELGFFSYDTYPVDFAEAAFALKDKDQISAPIRTDYGWHIIKLIEKRPMDSFEKMQPEIKRSLGRNDRSNLSKEAVYQKIMQKNGFKEYPENIKIMFHITDTTLVMGTWKVPANVVLDKVLFEIGNEKYTQNDFAQYVYTHEGVRKNNTYKQLVNQYYESFRKEKVLGYENKNLEKNYPAFKALMKEYRDGMLKFEITDQNVWTKAVKDTTGLKEFYEANKSKWMWPERIKGDVYICLNAEVAKSVRKMLKKHATVPEILEKINKESQLNVRVLQQGHYSKEDYPSLATFKWKKGISPVTENNKMFYVFSITDLLPVQSKKIDEAKGVITSAYQTYLEDTWVKTLRSKYPVQVNNAVLNGLLKKK